MTPAAVLRAAAALIEHEGWIQGDYFRPGEGYCVLGAIRDSAQEVFGHPVTVGACKAVRDMVGISGPASISLWNDSPKRTQAEVITTLRAAADKAEQES